MLSKIEQLQGNLLDKIYVRIPYLLPGKLTVGEQRHLAEQASVILDGEHTWQRDWEHHTIRRRDLSAVIRLTFLERSEGPMMVLEILPEGSQGSNFEGAFPFMVPIGQTNAKVGL